MLLVRNNEDILVLVSYSLIYPYSSDVSCHCAPNRSDCDFYFYFFFFELVYFFLSFGFAWLNASFPLTFMIKHWEVRMP